MPTVFLYIGGKSRIAHWIIDHIPKHRIFVEVFGGACNIILKKKPSKIEIYNDLNGDLANLFLMLKERGSEMKEYFKDFIVSREIRDKWAEEWMKGYKGKDDLERAIRFFYLANLSFQGIIDKSPLPQRDRNKAKILYDKIDSFEKISKRLRNVFIESMDFEECIRSYDGKDTVFYCDPPYLNKPYYIGTWSLDEHKRLAEVLHSVEGKVILSHYKDDNIIQLYKDWYIDEKKVKVITPSRAIEKIEILLMNFDWRKEPKFNGCNTLF